MKFNELTKSICLVAILCWSTLSITYGSEGIDEIKKLAESGDADACFSAGMIYLTGDEDVSNDLNQALALLRSSSEKGHLGSKFLLGKAYSNGWGVEKNYEEAVKYYKECAEKGMSSAQHLMGICYYNEQGVKKNEVEAAKYFLKSAQQNYPPAQRNIGSCFLNGWGVEKNEAEGVNWLRKSAENGCPDGMFCLAYNYYHGNGIKQSDADAIEWLKKSAMNSLPEAQFTLGNRYKNGRGVKKDPIEAFAYYSLAESMDKNAKQALEELSKSMSMEQINLANKRHQELQSKCIELKNDAYYEMEDLQRFAIQIK